MVSLVHATRIACPLVRGGRKAHSARGGAGRFESSDVGAVSQVAVQYVVAGALRTARMWGCREAAVEAALRYPGWFEGRMPFAIKEL